MIENGDANEIKRDYLEILESLLKLIQQKAKSKDIKTNDDVTINVGREKVYKGAIGEKPSKNTLTPEQVNKIRIAISDPKKSQGTISIKIGKQEVFRVQDGQVKTDKLGLAPIEQAPAQKTAQKSQVKTPDSVETIQKQIQDLQSKVEAQQKIIDGLQKNQQTPELVSKLAAQVSELSKSLEQQQKFIENIQKALSAINERSLSPIQNTKLQNWVGTVEKSLKQTTKKLFEKIKDVLTPAVTKLRAKVNKQASDLKQKIDTRVNGVKNTIKQSVQEVKSNINKSVDNAKAKALEQSIKALLKIFGQTNPDGSLSFKSASFDFEQQGESVVVRAKNGDIVLEDGELSPNLSRQQSEALDKVYSVVSRSHKLEIDATQKESASAFRKMGR
ncbi:apolipoprotein A1/A4/E family protein [Nostoc sp. FACHB-87]|uniref:apolipoprotein A1/A4/E family protein n=1 Tax=Nostocales TaxID=1161 RepID=UPI00168376C0|nr:MULTISPECIES: apolipoprotein A1/A4/E family protein [Nostocales]MBD2303396.1 apolipoprotein A1/A4/E family protein [Nostoc sp. FACHB-190]MBD2458985.1 apolipoprotein A1/A4/E family protein [Nostoc sp. FACHB-87]MBD2479996.1 apolipoprotein A1/A4/E family protein [Anabaena sp. FACHB-83]MBD2492464.1 apolipoprotein A1/A4/E family protein [Aulosira sp. FACHB-615]